MATSILARLDAHDRALYARWTIERSAAARRAWVACTHLGGLRSVTVLSVIPLLTGAGLMIQSFGRLIATRSGVDPENVLTVRITSVSCMPTARCSSNLHQVSIHGTLLIAGKGLATKFAVAFPHSPGARISASCGRGRR